MKRLTGRNVVEWTGIVIVTLIVVFPIAWGIWVSFTAPLGFSMVSQGLHLDNYKHVLGQALFLDNVRNSLIVSVGAVATVLPMAVLGGYALARFQFPGKSLSILLLVLPLLPAIAVLVPLIIYMRKLHLYNTLGAVILANVIFNTPFAVWMVRGFVLSIPVEIEEAAEIDGCSKVSCMRYVTLPLSAPGLIAVGIFVLINTWNNYLYAFAFTTSPKLSVLPKALLGFLGSWGTSYGGLTAAATLALIPPVVLFLLFQKWFIMGMLAGTGR